MKGWRGWPELRATHHPIKRTCALTQPRAGPSEPLISKGACLLIRPRAGPSEPLQITGACPLTQPNLHVGPGHRTGHLAAWRRRSSWIEPLLQYPWRPGTGILTSPQGSFPDQAPFPLPVLPPPPLQKMGAGPPVVKDRTWALMHVHTQLRP